MEEKPIGLSRRLARFVVETDHEEIPSEVFEHAKVAFMDWMAVTLAGKEDPLVHKLLRYADVMGGREQATILGHGVQKSASQAALINGSASHVLDYDDTLESFLGHPSVTLFPAILALAEWEGKSGLDFLTAYVIGLKAGATIGACAGLEHYMAGWHATSTIGHLASAMASAKLMGLTEEETVHALGIAGTQASGLKRVFGTMCKPFHAGRSSEVGLTAAFLAGDGFTSAEDILEGKHGFFHVLSGQPNAAVLDTLGTTWAIEKLAQKYHASCHATHSPIEAVLSIVKYYELNPGSIEAIRIYSSQLSLDAASQKRPEKGLEGKFCIPYCVANALLRGDTGTKAFTDQKVRAPEIRAYMEKISIHLCREFKGLEARVEVETKGGSIFTKETDILKDIPKIEDKKAKIMNKFKDLCLPVIGNGKTSHLGNAIESLEKIDDVRTLIGFL